MNDSSIPYLSALKTKCFNSPQGKSLNGPCYIFSLDNIFFNEWIFLWLSLLIFNITRSQSLFVMGQWVAYLASRFSITFCLSKVCFWVEYDNVVLHCQPIFHSSFTYRLTLILIRKNSGHIRPNAPICVTTGTKNDRRVHFVSSVIHFCE